MNPEASARIDSLLSGGFWAWVTDVARSLRQEKGTIIPPVQGGAAEPVERGLIRFVNRIGVREGGLKTALYLFFSAARDALSMLRIA